MIPVIGNSAKKATAFFFAEQTTTSLKNAIAKFETLLFDSNFIRRHAEKFDEIVFIDKIRNFVVSTNSRGRQTHKVDKVVHHDLTSLNSHSELL